MVATYTDPTPADIKADFAAFSAVDDAAIQRRIDRTGSYVDDSWMVSDYTYAKELLTAHYLTLDGLGSGTDAELASLGLSGITQLRSASLTVAFSDRAAAAVAAGGEFDETSFGRRFKSLLIKNKSGPLTTGGCDGGIAGAATDLPWAYALGGFGL